MSGGSGLEDRSHTNKNTNKTISYDTFRVAAAGLAVRTARAGKNHFFTACGHAVTDAVVRQTPAAYTDC